MTEFWVASGHHLTRRTDGGGLAVTDELLLAYLARPEVMPPEEACEAERALHRALMAEPRRSVGGQEVAAIADADARENWDLLLAFRDHLIAQPTLEAAYLSLIRRGVGRTPPMFLNHLVQLILRNALDGCRDPYTLRAAELMFRTQRVSFQDGAVFLADQEIVEAHEAERKAMPLLKMFGEAAIDELDVLADDTAFTYWSRSDAHTMVLNLGSNPNSREGLARAIEAWVRHMLGIAVEVTPLAEIRDADWRWYVGLDADATRIANTLWTGKRLTDEDVLQVLALFRLTLPAEVPVVAQAKGHPIYLMLAMTPDRQVRLKPQNLLTGLPILDPS
ncbi:MAG: DUF6352 family protein [Alphaproteobacteria bacterium]|nr:DUF6352 family protein [Alphaproteobacteria bacterium]